MDESLLLSLTDDALLAVLAYLSGEELLRCRQVCRRFRHLCLHPDLWRNVTLKDDDTNVLHGALSLAPCLGFLKCSSHSGSTLLATWGIVADTTCVVSHLELNIYHEWDLAPATAITHKFRSLGGLRSLYLGVGFYSEECRKLTMALLRAAFNIRGLQNLMFYNNTGNPLPDVSDYVDVKPSLTELVYCAPTAERSLLLLLQAHAATLQHAKLFEIDVPPVSLLAKIHGLRSLVCCPSEELSQLASLRYLESVEWWCVNGPVLVSAGALDFIRQAQHLRTVKIVAICSNIEAVFQSVVESRSVGLIEILDIPYLSDDSPPLDPWGLCMAPALANFQSLKHITIGGEVTDVFLRSISPTSAPALTTLRASCPEKTCLHAWLHSPAVQDVLTRNPRLHLQYFRKVRSDCSCQWCRWGCHQLLREWKWGFRVNASAHRRKSSCPPGCFQVAVPLSCSSCGHLISPPSDKADCVPK